MEHIEKQFPFGKNVMLNIIYDTLDRLGVTITSSNSSNGQMVFSSLGIEYTMKIDTVFPKENVSIDLAFEENDSSRDFVEALFDEINSTVAVTEN